MKNKVIMLIAISTIATLSFTFISAKEPKKKQISTSENANNAPAGGFALEDKF